jgi:CRISPR-associated protein Cas8a1/Csx13
MGKKQQQPVGPDRLTMDLFAPGMSAIHRAGLGGLACTLKKMEARFPAGDFPWTVTDRLITLKFGKPESAGEYLKRLFAFAFKITDVGLISLPGQYGNEPSAAILADLQSGLTLTFLQHGKTRKMGDPTQALFDPTDGGGPGVVVPYRKCEWFKHQTGWESFIDIKGRLKTGMIPIEGPLSPGTVVRHVAFISDTAAEDPPERMLPLYFALVGCLPLAVNRGVAALVVPDVRDLTEFVFDRPFMTPSTAVESLVGNAADAVLQAQVRVRVRSKIAGSAIPGCSAMTFMPTPWASQQKSRVATITVSQGEDRLLDRFSKALAALPTRVITRTVVESSGRGKAKVVTSRQESFRSDSIIRPVIAENLAAGRKWYAGFAKLMFKTNPATGKQYRNHIYYERQGLNDMMQNTSMWDEEGEALVVKAVHEAIRRTYGRIRDETDGPGGKLSQATKNRWERFREKLRLDLVGGKTEGQVRFALADLFSRGGPNSTLQESWAKVLPVIRQNWTLARDLGLVALVSYVGKGETGTELADPAVSIDGK